MQIITAGWPYIDIDAYAGIIAYSELLELQNIEAAAVSTAPLNESIPPLVKQWKTKLKRKYIATNQDRYTLIDISDPEYFEKFVDLDQVTQVIDHHTGFEEYWKSRINKEAKIEFIGAACTLVYEYWQAAGLLQEISQTSARLLICGILDNTLNFKARVSTSRDEKAYDDLVALADLPKDWPQTYFECCEKAITSDIAGALDKDIKHIDFRTYNQNLIFAQVVLWDAPAFFAKNINVLDDYMKQFDKGWFINLISLKQGQSYFYANDTSVKEWLIKLLALKSDDVLLTSNRLWLRKEVVRQDKQT